MADEKPWGKPAASVRGQITWPGLSPEPDLSMSEYEFRLLRDYIHEYCGIFYDDAKATTLSRRLAFRLKLLDITTFAEYYNYLRYNPHAREEMDDLIPHLTNNETYFFREMGQLNALVGETLHNVMVAKRKKGERSIRILSCGCSSGEEAYTVAMLIDENRAVFDGFDIGITGVDIDRKVLERAVKGEYTSYSLRATDRPRIDRFFRKEGEVYRLVPAIRDRVRFVRGNINDRKAVGMFRGVDVILCRNVLIYFSETAIRNVAESFHDALSDDGYLFLGHSESLSRITDIYHARRYPGAIVYSKGGEQA